MRETIVSSKNNQPQRQYTLLCVQLMDKGDKMLVEIPFYPQSLGIKLGPRIWGICPPYLHLIGSTFISTDSTRPNADGFVISVVSLADGFVISVVSLADGF